MSENNMQNNLQNQDTWIRLLFMILFGFIYWVAKFVFWVTVILQFGFVLITNGKNESLLAFSDKLTNYLFEIFQFLAFNKDEKPFPFDEKKSATDNKKQTSKPTTPPKSKTATTKRKTTTARKTATKKEE